MLNIAEYVETLSNMLTRRRIFVALGRICLIFIKYLYRICVEYGEYLSKYTESLSSMSNLCRKNATVEQTKRPWNSIQIKGIETTYIRKLTCQVLIPKHFRDLWKYGRCDALPDKYSVGRPRQPPMLPGQDKTGWDLCVYWSAKYSWDYPRFCQSGKPSPEKSFVHQSNRFLWI